MTAIKDQRRLVNRCITEEIPVFTICGNDVCAQAAIRAYIDAARQNGCSTSFIHELEQDVLACFKDYQNNFSELVKIPD